MNPHIPDDQITFAGENKYASYYRVGQSITVRMFRNSENELVYLCLTCIKNDCSHARAVERFTTPRKAVA